MRELPQVYSRLISVTSEKIGIFRRDSAAAALGIWLSMLTSLSPFMTAMRSYFVDLFGLTGTERNTVAPFTSSSLQRPVFLTWHFSVLPSISQ